jgi:hypothetical protein
VTQLENAISKIYGEPSEKAENSECPGGPLTTTIWSNGLVINSAENKFMGWSVRPYSGGSDFTTVTGIGIGSTLSDLQEMYEVEVFESSLGTEFLAGEIGGLLTSDAPDGVITDMWAGATCMFR